MLYERKPVTLAALEKVMGKKPFAETMGPFVTVPPGKPTLVVAGGQAGGDHQSGERRGRFQRDLGRI